MCDEYVSHQQCKYYIHRKLWFVGWLISDVKLGNRWCMHMAFYYSLYTLVAIQYINNLYSFMHAGIKSPVHELESKYIYTYDYIYKCSPLIKPSRSSSDSI